MMVSKSENIAMMSESEYKKNDTGREKCRVSCNA